MSDADPFAGTPFEGFKRITDYAQVEEALRLPTGAPRYRELAEPFEGGTVLKLHGDHHKRRRRMESTLFRPDTIAHYERDVLVPMIERVMASVEDLRDDTGEARFDLVPLARRLIMEVTATIIGLDDVTSRDSTDEVAEILAGGLEGIKAEWIVGDPQPVLQESLKLKQRFWDLYVEPAYRRRKELFETEGADAMPLDLLSLIVQDEDEEWDDDLVLRECIVYLVGVGATTPTMATHAIIDIEQWLATRPEQRGRLQDEDFAFAVGEESMRLHPVAVALVRHYATGHEGKTVSIESGDTLFLDLYAANCDEELFGDKPEVFDPDRPVREGIPRYGLAFGGGRHLCLGLPLAVGQRDRGTKGLAYLIVKALVDANLRLDPARPLVKAASLDDRSEQVPVILSKR